MDETLDINSQDILNTIKIGILKIDSECNIIYRNKYLLDFFNISVISDLYSLIHPDDYQVQMDLCLSFKKDHIESDSICRFKITLTNNFNWIKIKRLFTLNPKYYIYTFEDVTDLKNLEKNFQQERINAELASKHKSLFLANMSHEIRTPINGILGMLTILEDTQLNNEQKNYIDMIRECSINLMTIIHNILDYSKLEIGKIKLDKKCIELRDTIESVNTILISKMYEKNIEYNYSISENIPEFMVLDDTRIKQILLNLLTNSIKFIDSNSLGKISLNISLQDNIQDNEDNVQNNVQNNVQMQKYFFIKFSITDTGYGIDKDDEKKLFKSFSQIESNITTKVHQGTGLGLAICKELVELMDGKIWLEHSEINKGSEFCFTIKTNFCSNENVANDNYDLLKGAKIFILDDKRENRLGISAMVKKWGSIPNVYSDPNEALYFLQDNTYDLGICDICLPGMNGSTFARNLIEYYEKKNKKQIPLIALSSLGEHTTSADFKAHLIKPVHEYKLKKICNDLLIANEYKRNEMVHIESKLTNYLNNNNLESKNIRSSIRILLVEDVPINQRVIISFLEHSEFKNIDIADNGKICLELLTKNVYDIVILDIRMPVLNGEYVIKYILNYFNGIQGEYKLKNNKKPYIIAVTAYCLKDDKDKYINMGFDNYIPKPIKRDELSKCMDFYITKILEH
jgi:signal transduction histidine kinase/DNA-binding response OmpR family regulator